jgi:small subunit ribosomal protein S17
MIKSRNIGVDVPEPKGGCENDRKCPFHGGLKLHGRTFIGTVKRVRLGKNAIVEWQRFRYYPKYERYEKRHSKVMAHNPECIDAVEGDTVRIMESRKLSKTKNFVIIQIMNKEAGKHEPQDDKKQSAGSSDMKPASRKKKAAKKKSSRSKVKKSAGSKSKNN